MSRHARIEEVSDSDPEEVAPESDDDLLPADHIISPSIMHPPMGSIPPAGINPAAAASSSSSIPQPRPPQEIPKNFHCLYAVYFDKTRSRAEGRQVSSKLAVENPLARDILDACQQLGLRVGFEPEKLHPKDWANPGRVRVLLKDENGKPLNPRVQNKHHLNLLVAQFLQAHPTDDKSPFRLRIHGLPMPDKLPDAPAAPRGWKIGKILPIHSPAYSGGGVSENPFKEAMAEMEKLGGMPGGMPGLPGMPGMPDMASMMGMGEPSSGAAEPKKKKDKKKNKA